MPIADAAVEVPRVDAVDPAAPDEEVPTDELADGADPVVLDPVAVLVPLELLEPVRPLLELPVVVGAPVLEACVRVELDEPVEVEAAEDAVPVADVDDDVVAPEPASLTGRQAPAASRTNPRHNRQ